MSRSGRPLYFLPFGALDSIEEKEQVNGVAIHVDPEEPDEWIISRNDVLQEVLKIPSEGRSFVTICEGYACGLPIRDISCLSQVLR